MGAVAFVLHITSANNGKLLLARASGRRREIAVRQALGASTTRIARQLLTESVLLGIAGGALGIVVGRAFLELLLAAQATTNLPRVEEITLDGRVLLFTFGVSIIAGLFFGSVPAWQLARSRSAEVLRDGARGSSGHQWARSTLVVSELALAMILLTGAGLLLRSFSLVQRVDPGLTTDHVLTFTLGRPRAGAAFFPASLERISAVPGVRSAAITNFLPLSGRGIGAWFNRIDRPLPENVRPTGTPYRVVSPDYFATVGIQLKRGRLFDTRDDRTAPAIVINEALARRYYPNEDPIGKPVYLGAPDNRLFESAPIVGVVGDTRDAGLGVDPLPIAYIPQAVIPMWPAFSYVVRTSGDPLSVVASVRRIVRDLDPNVPMRDVRTLDDLLGTTVAPARWSATLLAVFAGVALVMAVLGVFGVLSYIITQRTRELGIRIALGASAARVRRLVVMRGLRLVAAGLAIGIVGAAMLTRFMSSLLYGVTPTDRTTFVGVAVLLAVASVARRPQNPDTRPQATHPCAPRRKGLPRWTRVLRRFALRR
jgi:predicted permease